MGAQPKPAPTDIGTVVCTPNNPLPGQSVLVEVHAPDNTPYNNTEKFYIGINGVPGSRQYLQFSRPGKQTIEVVANGPAGPNQATVEVDVQAPPALGPVPVGAAMRVLPPHLWPEVGLPMLNVARFPHGSYQVAFGLGAFAGAEGMMVPPMPNPKLVAPVPKAENAVPNAAILPATNTLGAVKPIAAVSARGDVAHLPVLSQALGGQPTPPGIYNWDFGDETQLNTNVPYAEHDFEQALDPTREYQQFNVSVSSAGKTVTRTLAVYSSYVTIKKRMGILVPQVEINSFARKFGESFTGTMSVTNCEAGAITLTERRLIPMYADPSQIAIPLPTEKLATPLVVPGKSAISVDVAATFNQVPNGAVGFIAYYAGQSADGIPVRVGAHFDIAPEDRFTTGLRLGNIAVTHVPAGVLQSMLSNAVSAAGGTPVSLGDIRSAANAGSVDLAAFSAARPLISNANHIFSSPASVNALGVHPIAVRLASNLGVTADALAGIFDPVAVPTAPPPQEGSECDPDNLPDAIPDGFVCQATAEQRQVITPGRFMNARKGDLILSPGGNGLIGGLLRQVNPPQRYSHSGIMTRNHDQITHCTMSDDRMQAYPVGTDPSNGDPAPTDGFRPDVVKYGWPGVITQTVENAVMGEKFLDPETSTQPAPQQKWYTINAFGAQPQGVDLGGHWTIVPPLVVKPDPMVETNDIRQQMHAIAEDASAQTGKAHYRFYCYTDPTIGQTSQAPANVGWASGTFPAVCSAFVWLMMKKHNVHLEGMGATEQDADLEIPDKEAGAKVGPTTPDGLYLYTAADRLVAGNWLHNAIYNQAYAKTGWLGEVLTKAADHISNEMLNSFANDTTQTDDDNDTWQQTKDANAVSPDNLLFWDAPNFGSHGLYGYAERLIYREPRYDTITIYRWRKVALKGTLSGTVYFNNAPMAGATVQLYDGMTGFTDGNGKYQLQNVPYGKYVITAQKVQQDGTYLSNGNGTAVDIESPNLTQDIYLQPPPDVFRTVHISGTMHTRYTQWAGPVKISDESADEPFYQSLDVGPYSTHNETTITQDVESAHASLHVIVDWQLDKSINVSFQFQLHDQTAQNQFSLAEDCWQSWSANASADNDQSHVDFTVSNDLKQG